LKINENRKRKERKKKEREERTISTSNISAWHNASSTLLDVAAHIVGPAGCLQGSLGYRILPEAEKSHNIKEANPWIPSDTEP